MEADYSISLNACYGFQRKSLTPHPDLWSEIFQESRPNTTGIDTIVADTVVANTIVANTAGVDTIKCRHDREKSLIEETVLDIL